MKPIFIFSLPRAGSTLVQRVIARHPSVATAAEPWILLPIFSSLKKSAILADYNHSICNRAILQFMGGIQNGEHCLNEAICIFAKELYQNYCKNGESYFLDKTPRYHLICDKIIEAFSQEARFIFVWRNPLAVVASVIETFCKRRWNLYRWNIDFYKGLDNLISTCTRFSKLCINVRYEALIEEAETEWNRIFQYLDLSWDSAYASNMKKTIVNGMGDPVGQHQFDNISKIPLTKWRKSYSSPIRRKWARNYLKYIGSSRLKFMGYDYDKLVHELDKEATGWSSSTSDVLYTIRDRLWDIVHIDAQKKRRYIQKQGLRFYPWS